tara:strand:- start:22675 stop:22866 length:192 start_codon:yes stop_codon:yes gene_type:complete
MNELERISNELELATRIRNIESKMGEVTPLLDQLADMIDAKDVNVTKLIAIVDEYKRILTKNK